MLHHTNRLHRPAVRAVPLFQAPPTGGVSAAVTRPHLVPPLDPAADAAVADAPASAAPLVEAPSAERRAAEVDTAPELRAPRGADLTDAERVVLEDLFHRASQVRQVVLALLALGLLVLLVAMMR